MYLELDEQQRALIELARGLLEEVSPLARLHGTDVAPDPKVWQRLAEAGLTGLGVPEAHGGSAGGAVEVALILEEAGRVALPEPLRESAGILAPLLRAHGTPLQRERWLAPLAAGQTMLGVVAGGRRSLAAHRSVQAALVVEGGRCLLVPTERLDLRPVATTDPAHDVALVTDMDLREHDLLPGADATEVTARGAAASAAVLVGVSQRLLEIALEHATVREQFGRPIGSFQAVQHPLVDVHVALETARVATWYASLRLDQDADDAVRAAAVAKAAADVASASADRVALQVLGGIGFTWEHDLHRLSKRAAVLRAEFGPAREHHQRLGRALFA